MIAIQGSYGPGFCSASRNVSPLIDADTWHESLADQPARVNLEAMTTQPSTLETRCLGHSDIRVTTVGIGANTFGPPRLDEEQSKRVVDAALDLGVNFVDTAFVYGQGKSEEFLGRALRGRRDRMVIATKYYFKAAGEGSVSDRIVAQAEASLRKLGTDYIDLYQMHLPEPGAAADEVLEAMDLLTRSGKVRAIGACNYASWRLDETAHIAKTLGTSGFCTVQNYYNLLCRDIEREVIPWCRLYGVSVIPYHPLGGGFLTGKYRPGEPPPPGTRGAAGSGIVDHLTNDHNYSVLEQLQAFCAESGHTLGELAVGWLLTEPAVATVITGVSNPEQLESNLAGSLWKLSEDEKHAVDVITCGPKGVPWNPEIPPYA
jgi:aryl-alcohol dehydrogenase-like predicted oxidoreductase